MPASDAGRVLALTALAAVLLLTARAAPAEDDWRSRGTLLGDPAGARTGLAARGIGIDASTVVEARLKCPVDRAKSGAADAVHRPWASRRPVASTSMR